MGGIKKMSQSRFTKKELRKIIEWNQTKLYKIEQEEKKEEAVKLVGKCFKYRNCYSCPQGSKDYWWLYAKVLSMKPNGNLITFQFQTDRDGEIHINPHNIEYSSHKFEEWKSITNKQFETQWDKLAEKVSFFKNSCRVGGKL